MKLFSFRFYGPGALTLALLHGTAPPIAAAPVDDAPRPNATSPWLGSLPQDEFSRAVATLEAARVAEKTAARRLALGEITSKEWQSARDALQQAERRVKELLNREKARTSKATPLAFSLKDATAKSGSPTHLPFLVSMPPQKGNPKGSAPVFKSGAPGASTLASKAPRVTVWGQSREGSITPPVYGNRQMLHAPHKAGTRPLFAFVATLPSKTIASSEEKTVQVQTTAPPRISTPVPVVKTTRPEPKEAKPPAKNQAKNEPKNSGFSSADLRRLAQLEAELNRADRRLNAAHQALSEGQEQLNRFAGTLRQAMMEAGPDAAGLHPFVKVAEKYAGTPYVWGGESRRGFDCSGMIIRVMRDLGYKALPHSAAEQFKYGKPIAQPLLKPGDLVFFANTYKAGISHVGIYLGKRRFIHAAGTGKGTIVSSLDDSKFQSKYAGARRLIAARN